MMSLSSEEVRQEQRKSQYPRRAPAAEIAVPRGGGWNTTNRYGMSVGSRPDAYTNVVISNNVIQDARRAGLVIGTTFENVTVSNNLIDHPATQGVWIKSGVTGAGSFNCNTVANLNPDQVPFQNDSPSTFAVTLDGY